MACLVAAGRGWATPSGELRKFSAVIMQFMADDHAHVMAVATAGHGGMPCVRGGSVFKLLAMSVLSFVPDG